MSHPARAGLPRVTDAYALERYAYLPLPLSPPLHPSPGPAAMAHPCHTVLASPHTHARRGRGPAQDPARGSRAVRAPRRRTTGSVRVGARARAWRPAGAYLVAGPLRPRGGSRAAVAGAAVDSPAYYESDPSQAESHLSTYIYSV